MALAGNSTQGANGQQNWSNGKMQHSQAAGSSESAGASRNEIKQAQQKLQSEGLYNGQIDGIDGHETQQALKQFQQKNKLHQTGQLDEQTEAKLGLNEATEGSGGSQPPSGMSGNSKSSTQNSNSMKSPTTQNK
ncbi:MAG TPA: peptidoglycan-binding domain-containing protein [Stellaceae bacterium]|nr:peptidoglycan-binding domain-containing protein [Stellaceae bacterium]